MGRRSETKRKAIKGMNSEKRKRILNRNEEYIDEEASTPSQHTTVSNTRVNGVFFETSLYTRLKFIQATRKAFCCIRIFH